MSYVEFRDLILSWGLSEGTAEDYWTRCGHFLRLVTAEHVEMAFRNTLAELEAEADASAIIEGRPKLAN